MSQFAVNGKVPIAVWCPSRDDAGNGTTTLNDLVGSNNGTLTNMDPATDWVSDTGAGGIRALDFDGSNDHVVTSSFSVSTRPTLSCWFRTSNASLTQRVFSRGSDAAGNDLCVQVVSGTVRVIAGQDTFGVGGRVITSGVSITNNVWTHVAVAFGAANLTVWVNGSQSTFIAITTATTSLPCVFGRQVSAANEHFNGRLDDIRIFNTALDASDVAYLWHSGNGRGRLANTQSRRRRNARGGYGL